MADFIQRALAAKRESKHVEFKSKFDPTQLGDWCELIKDIVAIANSGGGIIIFGLDSTGNPTSDPVNAIAKLDPADIQNRISSYTGPVDLEFVIKTITKQKQSLVAFVIPPVAIPIVFQHPGNYEVVGGKKGQQKTAFGRGTVFFRHGAKSEPGNSEDMRRAIERQLDVIRRSWVKGVRRVVEAPPGTQIISVQQTGGTHANLVSVVRAVNDPGATPVRLTRDQSIASGTFVHEAISEGIFDEINNVIDANRALAKGQQIFHLGPSIYYRIYAERQHAKQSEETIAMLLHSGVVQIYSPALFWTLSLPKEVVARTLTHLYLRPVHPHVHFLTRCAILMGEDFSGWLYDRWNKKWKNHPQPPSIYRTLKEMIASAKVNNRRLVAVRVNPTTQFAVEGESLTAKEILEKPERGALLLSKACLGAFEGSGEMRAIARILDFLTYGQAIQERGKELGRAVLKEIGGQEAGDLKEPVAED